MDYGKLLEYHIQKQADITVVCKDMPASIDTERFGTIRMNEESRIEEFEEKPVVSRSNTISCGIYVIRRRQLIELIERAEEEERYDFVRDILVRYKDMKRIYGYKIKEYWNNIASVEDYFRTNMDFLKPEVRQYFFREYPGIYTKVVDLPPAKYNVGVNIKNSLISSGCIINGAIEDSVIFKGAFVGNNCYIKNSIILNDVYIGDNSHIENCIVESHGTIQANSYYKEENGIKIVVENNERYVI
jgi:glucose-1-phosphate adenylyltransferase